MKARARHLFWFTTTTSSSKTELFITSVAPAKKRGENSELAAICGLLHDLYAYKSDSYEDHAHKGAEYARKILDELDLTSKEETDVICSAIWHHDSKAQTDSPMDEMRVGEDVYISIAEKHAANEIFDEMNGLIIFLQAAAK